MDNIEKPQHLNETTYNAYMKLVKVRIAEIESAKRSLRKTKRVSTLTYDEWVNFIIGIAKINEKGVYYYHG